VPKKKNFFYLSSVHLAYISKFKLVRSQIGGIHTAYIRIQITKTRLQVVKCDDNDVYLNKLQSRVFKNLSLHLTIDFSQYGISI
jgi:hypothetical protein